MMRKMGHLDTINGQILFWLGIQGSNWMVYMSDHWTNGLHESLHVSTHCRTFTRDSLSSVVQSCLTLCNPMDYSTVGLPVHHQLPEPIQTNVHRVGDTIQPSHPLSAPSPSAFNLSQHQDLFQSVSSLHQGAKVLEFQLQHQSFQWILRTDFL